MKISEMLEEAFVRPEIFIGFKSVSRLYAFITGYSLALFRAEVQYEDDVMKPFGEWVAARYRIEAPHTWADIALFVSVGDDHAAFDLAKDLWGEYRLEKTSI